MINYYGLAISLSILLSAFLAEKEVKKTDRNFYWGLLFWVLVLGFVGARLYHVIDFWFYYKENLLQIINLKNGGLGIWGGLSFGFLTLVILCKNNKQSILSWLDLFSLYLPLSQSIGRWGNFFNNELYGKITSLPWGFVFEGEKRHPLFLYESLGNILIFIFLLLLRKRKKNIRKGEVFYLYVALYSVLRFFIDFLRSESFVFLGFNVSQTICIILFIVSLIFWSKRSQNDIYNK